MLNIIDGVIYSENLVAEQTVVLHQKPVLLLSGILAILRCLIRM